MRWLILAILLSVAASAYGGTYTASTCSYADVNTIINGPTHTAVDGDVIQIPSGTCTWASNLTITKNITLIGNGTANSGSGSFGAGALNTVIVDNAGTSNPLIGVQVSYSASNFLRVSTLDIEPNSAGTPLWSPISVAGTCTSSNCPQMRIDNIGFGLSTNWNESGNSSNADWMIRTDNMIGVIDHATLPNGSSVELLNINDSSWLNVGGYGDNSWAQADSFGSANDLYIENIVAYSNQALGDCDNNPIGGGIGGCRLAVRYSEFTFEPGAFALIIPHGLDTDGRPQGGRQLEAYGNTVSCPTPSGSCNTALIGYRSGTGFVFNNTATTGTGTSLNNFVSLTIYRNVYGNSSFGYCGGLNANSPWDTNDNTSYVTSVATSASGLTLTDTGQTWTVNQWAPSGAPYSVYDTTQGFVAEIASNTSNTVTVQSPISESSWTVFGSADHYQIIRATVCADQAGRGQGNYISGSTPSPASSLNQSLDPIYEWDDAAPNDKPSVNVGPNDTGRDIAYRDWYTDGSLGSPQAQTTSSSPFSCNGSTGGVGFGTLARRPASCSGACSVNSPGCGYFATDSGSQGTLYVWVSGAWNSYYQPYTYPHPLDNAGGVVGGSVVAGILSGTFN